MTNLIPSIIIVTILLPIDVCPLDYEQIITPYFSISDRPKHRRIIPVIVDDTNEVILTSEIVNVVDEVDSLSIADIDDITIEYTSLENIDPNFKG